MQEDTNTQGNSAEGSFVCLFLSIIIIIIIFIFSQAFIFIFVW